MMWRDGFLAIEFFILIYITATNTTKQASTVVLGDMSLPHLVKIFSS